MLYKTSIQARKALLVILSIKGKEALATSRDKNEGPHNYKMGIMTISRMNSSK